MTNIKPNQLGLYSAVVMLAAVVGFAYAARSNGIFACQATDNGSDEYLGICNVKNYGDYDHGAFWFGLENDARKAAQQADILFLGNSRMQFGLSTPVVDNWFNANNLSYYLLGFSHHENYNFFRPLLQRIQPAAEMYVINLDHFFDGELTGPANSVMNEAESLNRYIQKRYWQKAHAILCRTIRSLCGNRVSYIRKRSTGTWYFKGNIPAASAQSVDRRVSNNSVVDNETLTNYEHRARSFLATLPVEPWCMVLTVVPDSDTSLGTSRALAERLGLSFVAPELVGLETFDGSHLNPKSAARWSAAFIDQLAPRVEQCRQGATG